MFPVDILFINNRHIPEVLVIENDSFEFPWQKENFICCLRQSNHRCMVAEHEDRVVGFMIYELCNTRIEILNLAVAADFLRQGIGTQMVSKLIGELSSQHRTRIILEVRETNLVAQLFFRSNGFRDITVLREFYEDTPEDAYSMQYRYNPTPKKKSHYNRIARFIG